MIAVIWLQMTSTTLIRDSQDQVVAGNLGPALERARNAQSLRPYAATPYLQEALILEDAKEFDAAARAVQKAIDRESTNWRPWFILSRIEDARGRPRESIAAYARAASLNPNSQAF